MTASELSAVIRGVVPAVREYVSGVVDGLSARLAALEGRAAVTGPAGRDGKDGERGEKGIDGLHGVKGDRGEPGLSVVGPPGDHGEKGDPGDHGEAGLPGKDGRDGVAGKDGNDGLSVIGPPGEKGDPGETGPCGSVGPVGPMGPSGETGKAADPVSLEQMVSTIEAHPAAFDKAIQRYLELHPARDGMDGANGKDGRDGQPGVPGQSGEKGADGRDGIDGKDGLGFDDVHVEHDGERRFTFSFTRGDRSKTFGAFVVPSLLDRGVFQIAKTYEQGDVVTFGGSLFVATRETKANEKPEDASGAWRLAVKRGRDGRDGKSGTNGTNGRDGKDRIIP